VVVVIFVPMRATVSTETIDAILSHVELKHIYRRTLPLTCARRHLFSAFLKDPAALAHATLLERTFDLPFRIIDTGPNVLSIVFNMYLIETSPDKSNYPDFDWEEFKKTTLKGMKIIRKGGNCEQNLKRKLERKIYRCG
jgi:CBS-domain-containing membrane protein